MTEEKSKKSGRKLTRVAKTLILRRDETDLKPLEIQESPNTSPSPINKLKTKVAKTQLDVRMLMNVQSQFGERTNERLQQVIADRQSNPVKPIEPIEAQKKVKSCPFSWTDESAKERVKYCDTCERAIYNFDGLELEQAKALILTRENRVKFVLHERPDGKFMTSDCPIAQRKRFQVVGLVAGAFIGVVALVAAFILIGPTSQPPVSNNNEVTAPAPATTADADSSASNPPGTVTHHYEAGDPMPVVPPSEPAKKNTEPSFSAQEQKGEFWQFPNGQPADDFSRRPGASAEQ